VVTLLLRKSLRGPTAYRRSWTHRCSECSRPLKSANFYVGVGLRFVTPGGLAPRLTVRPRIGEVGIDDHTLPTVMTCQSYVELPPYSSLAIMRERFLTAIHDGQNWFGFA
jgi:hypothetical protein